MDEMQRDVPRRCTRSRRACSSRSCARHEGALAGHVSSIRVYNRTWMSQHLARDVVQARVAPSEPGRRRVLRTEPRSRILQDLLPARVHKLAGARLRRLRAHDARHAPVGPARAASRDALGGHTAESMRAPSTSRSWKRATDRPGRWSSVTSSPVSRPLVLQSRRPPRTTLRLAAAEQQFARGRALPPSAHLLAMKRGVCLGFAMAEVSSPGLNLSEALSMFRIHVTSDGEALGTQRAPRALATGVQSLYRQRGALALPACSSARRGRELPRASAPRASDDTWLVWTCHRALYPRFCDYVDRLFDVLERRARRA